MDSALYFAERYLYYVRAIARQKEPLNGPSVNLEIRAWADSSGFPKIHLGERLVAIMHGRSFAVFQDCQRRVAEALLNNPSYASEARSVLVSIALSEESPYTCSLALESLIRGDTCSQGAAADIISERAWLAALNNDFKAIQWARRWLALSGYHACNALAFMEELWAGKKDIAKKPQFFEVFLMGAKEVARLETYSGYGIRALELIRDTGNSEAKRLASASLEELNLPRLQ